VAEHALVTCPACQSEIWPFEEMDPSGNMVSRCPVEECGQPFPRVLAPAAVAEPAPRTATVVPIRAAPGQSAPAALGSPELRYLRDSLTQCEADALALTKRIQRALALIE
jgi:hypothetical protein